MGQEEGGKGSGWRPNRDNEVDLRLARDGSAPDMGMLGPDLAGVPCCESHEQMGRAVRGTAARPAHDSEEGAQDGHWACRSRKG